MDRATRIFSAALLAASSTGVLGCGGGVENNPRVRPDSTAGGGNVNAAGSSGTSSGGQSAGSSAGGAAGGATPNGPKPTRNTERNIVSTHLELDLAVSTGVATIELGPSLAKEGATFEIGDLAITRVEGDKGPLDVAFGMSSNGSLLDVGVAKSDAPTSVKITYSFQSHTMFDGWNEATSTSFLWPYFCGNWFPCRSTPADGVKFSMNVTGSGPGLTALYPEALTSEAPSYMPAVTVGKFTEVALGSTSKGTKLSAWLRPGQDATAAAQGTDTLLRVFDFYERTYGDYAYGAKAGSVAVDWGGSGFRGMEHHPYWHVNQNNFDNPVVHAHEAAHGWFGNGVRLACWEDFMLSEGTASYLAAHALEQFGVDAWPDYECRLQRVCDKVVLTPRCSGVDILTDPAGSAAPYMKGAFFLRAVAQLIGAEELDGVLSQFYENHVGKAASIDELLTAIRGQAVGGAKADFDSLVASWLESPTCPIAIDAQCP